MALIRFQKEKIDITEIYNQCNNPADGGLVIFTGRPRRDTDDPYLTGIEYEIYESMALKEINRLVQIAEKESGARVEAVIHRYGFVPVGEDSILILVASGHRKAAFACAEWMIDEFKKSVPVWKKLVTE